MSEHKIPIPGRIYNASGGNVCGADDIIDDVKGKKQSQINTEVDNAIQNEIERATEAENNRYTKNEVYKKEETYNKNELNNLITTPSQEYVTVVATDQTTAATDVLPATGSADTIYRVGNWDGTQYNDSVFSEYAWNGSAYIKLSTKSQVGEVYDISANHADTKYADLAAALGVDGANIPQSLRRGGMSIKYVQSSDNKYVQYRCIADEFTTDITKWQGSDILTEISDTCIDLEIKDENNNVLSQFYNGHVRTKNFDSAKSVTKDKLNQEIDKLPSIENGTNDLDIKDENGNVIAQFYGGNIKTKNFDSNKIVLKNSLKGKRVGILGDSISSYRGLIPSGYVGWYPTGDVTDSSQMWFGIVRDLLEVDITNCSWAGSKVCGNSGNASAEAGCSTKRISDLAANGTPDVVICYIGINDFGDIDITMGEWNNTNEIPSEGTISNFANAYAIMVNKIMSTYPMAKVYCCTLLETRQNDVDNNKIPTINHHGEALEDWNDIIRKISKYFGAEIIDLHSCGINWYNIPTYAPEDAIHPWADGQKLIGNSIVKYLI